MRRLRATGMLWAFDALTRWGFPVRPKTLATCLAIAAPLALVPVVAVGLFAGRFLVAAGVATLPWPLLAALWQCWGIVRIVVTQTREELTAPAIAPLLSALDLPANLWVSFRFGLPLAAETLYMGLFAGAALAGVGASAATVAATVLALAVGLLLRFVVMAQLTTHRYGTDHWLALASSVALPATTATPGVPAVPVLVVLLVVAAGLSVGALVALRRVLPPPPTPAGELRRGARVARPRLPVVLQTVVALRAGVWMPRIRSLLVRTLALFSLAAAAIAGLRASVPLLARTLDSQPDAVHSFLTYAAFLATLGVAEPGIVWYGVRSRGRQLRLAWELGGSYPALAIGSVIAHLVDAAALSLGTVLLCLGAGSLVSGSLVLLPLTVMAALVLGQAMFRAPSLPDGRVRASLAGALAGLIASVPALAITLDRGSGVLLGLALLILMIGGAAWISQRTIKNASFSIA